jgi:uncharacterized protein (DUF433 family)
MALAMATAAQIVASAQITKVPGVCGGRACIDNTRIRVIDVVQLQLEGKRPEEMQDAFAIPLTMAQIHLALAYAAQHPAEIEADFEAQRGAVELIERERAAFFESRRQ